MSRSHEKYDFWLRAIRIESSGESEVGASFWTGAATDSFNFSWEDQGSVPAWTS